MNFCHSARTSGLVELHQRLADLLSGCLQRQVVLRGGLSTQSSALVSLVDSFFERVVDELLPMASRVKAPEMA